MANLRELGWAAGAVSAALALGWGCAATDDVIARGGNGAAAGADAQAPALPDASGNPDVQIDVKPPSDADINESCEAAVEAQSTYGCDYWALNTDTLDEPTGFSGGAGACFAAFIANRGTQHVTFTLERAGYSFTEVAKFTRIPKGQGPSLSYEPYDPELGIPPNEVAIVFLSQGTPARPQLECPPGIETAFVGDPATHWTGRGHAFNLTTSAPVSAYQIFPYGGSETHLTSATLLIPTSAWDTNYIAINAYAQGQIWPDKTMPSLDILAREDGTVVKINPRVAILPGVGVAGAAAGQIAEYTLSRGEYLQITQPEELTGSVIQSNKPIGVFGASTGINVPVNKEAADAAHQQLLPIKQLGHEYVAVRYRARRLGNDPVDEEVPWRLVGAVAGTQLTYSPAPPPGAPTTLEQGELAEFWSKEPFTVTSQDKEHPFYIGAYMTGSHPLLSDPTAPGADGFLGEGDPEWVNVVPVAQFLDSYVFFTDPTYPETNLVVVRRRDDQGNFADVTLECAGTLTGWTAVGDYEWTRVDVSTGNFEPVNGCQNGRQVMQSSAPFGVTVWGWGSVTFGPPGMTTAYTSYAYPAGMGTKLINQVEIPVVK
jgi:hypothetical protein